MMEEIMNLIKGQVEKTVASDMEIPKEKKKVTVETTTNSLIDGLKQYATPDNMSALTSLFGGGKLEDTDAVSMSKGLESNMVSALTSKAGLSTDSAQKLAMIVIPAVISLFGKKISDKNAPGFNIGSLIDTFTGTGKGKNKNSNPLGNLMGMLGGLFGGNKKG